MKILLDTNVVLDVLLAREPFVQQAREIFLMIENERIEGYLCATSIVTLHYLVSKQKDRLEADSVISDLLSLFRIAAVDNNVLLHASASSGNDYEDSVIYTAAEQNEVDLIITRDATGFRRSKVSVVSPEVFLVGLIGEE